MKTNHIRVYACDEPVSISTQLRILELQNQIERGYDMYNKLISLVKL